MCRNDPSLNRNCTGVLSDKETSTFIRFEAMLIIWPKIEFLWVNVYVITKLSFFSFSFPPQAHEYNMAFIELPADVSWQN